MSDPVTSAEVEDVLSSIRRLVSEDKRPMPASKPDAHSDRLVLTPALRVADEPSVKVAEQSAQSSFPKAPEWPERQEPDTSDLSIDSLVSDDEPLDVFAKNIAHEDAPTEQEEPLSVDLSTDYSADPYNFDNDDDGDGEGAPVYLGHRDPEAGFEDDTDQIHVVQDDVDQNSGVEKDADAKAFDEEVVDANVAGTNGADIKSTDQSPASEEPTVGSSSQQQEIVMGSDEQDLIEETQQPVPDAIEPERASALDETPIRPVDRDTYHSDASDTATKQQASTDSKAIALSAKIAALETAIGKISDTWELEDGDAHDFAGSSAAQVIEWEDDQPAQNPFIRPKDTPLHEDANDAGAEDVDDLQTSSNATHTLTEPLETIEEPQELTETVAPETSGAPSPDEARAGTEQEAHVAESRDEAPLAGMAGVPIEEQLLDEEALRDLVSEIVRAELQGALGERITRNVRKLVRREIHRALTAQELE